MVWLLITIWFGLLSSLMWLGFYSRLKVKGKFSWYSLILAIVDTLLFVVSGYFLFVNGL